ncbi:YraN family protein [Enemella sp. A6]|uniref:YraN family protein n=1 Tax=Enemella sp. A6 TaxID=3440152 RepID=UPI003EBD7601
MNRNELGKHGEQLAASFLEASGWTVIDRNWHCAEGELDIVAISEDAGESTLAFCEVKTRTGLGYGSPLESITDLKVRRLRHLTARWLLEHPITATHIRLDAIGVLLVPGREPQIHHLSGIGR